MSMIEQIKQKLKNNMEVGLYECVNDKCDYWGKKLTAFHLLEHLKQFHPRYITRIVLKKYNKK